MKYIEIPDGSPAFHLACEEVIFQREREGDILLLWTNRPVIVCGAHQNIYQETSVWRARQAGIEILRRVSGGGTVYHDEGNLNYSVIMDEKKFHTYDDLLRGMLTAMNRAGIPAEKGRICDINVGGRKVSGNAQRIAHGRILHHGTLLYDADLSVLREVSGRAGRKYTSRATQSNPAEVGNIKPFWDGRTGGEDGVSGVDDGQAGGLQDAGNAGRAANAGSAGGGENGASGGRGGRSIGQFREALIENYPEEIERVQMTADELAEARRLETEKYGDWKWNFGKSPKFSCEAEASVGGSPCRVSYSAKKGIVEEMELSGAGVAAGAGERFAGCRLDPDEILETAKGVTDAPEELAELIL